MRRADDIATALYYSGDNGWKQHARAMDLADPTDLADPPDPDVILESMADDPLPEDTDDEEPINGEEAVGAGRS
jgi:hypothetical protein